MHGGKPSSAGDRGRLRAEVASAASSSFGIPADAEAYSKTPKNSKDTGGPYSSPLGANRAV